MTEKSIARRQELAEQLRRGLQEFQDSDRYRAWLDVAAKFHAYSWRNTMLIMLQRPNASRVAGFHSWHKVGRRVRKGEKGIAILAPQTHRRASEADEDEEEPRETVVASFRTVHVFDVSQTDGQELPTIVDELDGAETADLYEKLDGLRTAEGLTLEKGDKPGAGGANGSYSRPTRTIWLRPDLPNAQATKTYAHELAHHFAEHETNAHCRDEGETIAESVAYIVLGHYGMDAGAYSFGYLASWSNGDDKTFTAKLAEIQRSAGAMIDKLEAAA